MLQPSVSGAYHVVKTVAIRIVYELNLIYNSTDICN